jgi:hypothetical protein
MRKAGNGLVASAAGHLTVPTTMEGRMLWFRKKKLSQFEKQVTREVLIQSGRIAFVDDESPLLIDELRRIGFAVDHDRSGDDLRSYDLQIYDVAVVDFHGVGAQLGPAQGLELVRHIRRVSPRTRVVAYTSRSLSAAESEFFRLSHTVLPKDLGLGESMSLLERELQVALSKQYLFDALLEKLKVATPERKAEMEKALVKALSSNDSQMFSKYLSKTAGFVVEKAVDVILAKLFA